MKLDADALDEFTVRRRPQAFLRVTPLRHAATPLGMGYGETRFASPSDRFKVIYIAASLSAATAETLIRDRFVGRTRRRLHIDEIEDWGVTEVRALSALTLLDLTKDALVALGVHTDTLRAQSQRRGRLFSEALYAQAPKLDGILYPSRLTNARCIAVYDRGVPKLAAGPVVPLIRQPGLVPALTRLRVTVAKPKR